MRLRLNREEMADALTAVCAVAATRTPKEILKCTRIEAKGDVLLLSATDNELALRCAVTQIEVDRQGEAVVVADTLSRIVRECGDELLALETDESQLHVRGASSHFQIVTHDPSEFPAVVRMEEEPDFVVELDVLRSLVEWTQLAAARESTRYAINGVLWEIGEDKVTLAATDGRRLSVASGDLVKGAAAALRPIVPVKALQVLSRLVLEGDTHVSAKSTGNQLILNMGGAMLATSLVEGHFPNYRDVIPVDCDRTARLDTAEFTRALKQAALLTNEESKGVRLSFAPGELTLSSRAPEQGEATVSMQVDYHAEPLDIGFNPVFLLDVMRVVAADEVTLALKDSNRPGVLRAGEFIYVVMPVNLSSA